MTKTTKFKIGDKVRVIEMGAAGLPIGTEAKVFGLDCDGDVYLDIPSKRNEHAFYLAKRLELVSPKPTKNQRITTLEQKVEALQAEIEALKATQKPPVTVIADAIKRYKERTPNQKRKAIIDEAKAFVAENLSKNHPHTLDDGLGAWFVSEGGIFSVTTEVDFVINSKKSAVVALVKGIHNKNVRGKGIAKCNPSDVFNEHIGKAIALGRALGLDVKRFEKATQPTEFAVGQVTKGTSLDTGKVTRIEDDKAYTERYTYWFADTIKRGKAFIIDDTEAQY